MLSRAGLTTEMAAAGELCVRANHVLGGVQVGTFACVYTGVWERFVQVYVCVQVC